MAAVQDSARTPAPARTITTAIIRPLLPEEEMWWNLGLQWAKTFCERLGALSGAVWTICLLEPQPVARPVLRPLLPEGPLCWNLLYDMTVSLFSKTAQLSGVVWFVVAKVVPVPEPRRLGARSLGLAVTCLAGNEGVLFLRKVLYGDTGRVSHLLPMPHYVSVTITTTVVGSLLPSEEMYWNLVFQYVKTFFERLGALSGAIWTIYKVQPVPVARHGFATKVRTQFAWDNFLGC